MLDPDIQGRLRALKTEHLAALFDYLLGSESRESGRVRLTEEGSPPSPQTKTPGTGRGASG
jgi:hypothetical protein